MLILSKSFPEYVPEVEGQEDPLEVSIQFKRQCITYFIGDSFQSAPRLQAMMSRPTVELSLKTQVTEIAKDGDLVNFLMIEEKLFVMQLLLKIF